MPLELPSDLATFCDDEHGLRSPGAYALRLSKPDDPAAAWDRRVDVRPPWFEKFLAADEVFYVGQSRDLLARLEDHRDGDVRQVSLVAICDVVGLHTVWWADDTEPEAVEYNLAASLRRERPAAFVHSR